MEAAATVAVRRGGAISGSARGAACSGGASGVADNGARSLAKRVASWGELEPHSFEEGEGGLRHGLRGAADYALSAHAVPPSAPPPPSGLAAHRQASASTLGAAATPATPYGVAVPGGGDSEGTYTGLVESGLVRRVAATESLRWAKQLHLDLDLDLGDEPRAPSSLSVPSSAASPLLGGVLNGVAYPCSPGARSYCDGEVELEHEMGLEFGAIGGAVGAVGGATCLPRRFAAQDARSARLESRRFAAPLPRTHAAAQAATAQAAAAKAAAQAAVQATAQAAQAAAAASLSRSVASLPRATLAPAAAQRVAARKPAAAAAAAAAASAGLTAATEQAARTAAMTAAVTAAVARVARASGEAAAISRSGGGSGGGGSSGGGGGGSSGGGSGGGGGGGARAAALQKTYPTLQKTYPAGLRSARPWAAEPEAPRLRVTPPVTPPHSAPPGRSFDAVVDSWSKRCPHLFPRDINDGGRASAGASAMVAPATPTVAVGVSRLHGSGGSLRTTALAGRMRGHDRAAVGLGARRVLQV